MKNKFLAIIVIALLTVGNAVAQQFEWVRGYASGEQAAIVGSVTDSLGNLYILGSINANTCWENGSHLMPSFPYPYSYNGDNGDVLIAKISPDGDLVWYKVIHGDYRNSAPYDIKPLGDTAFACLVTMPLASTDYYLYYLDTLVRPTWNYYDGIPLSAETPWPDYPLNAKEIFDCYPLALITFDFDGNVLEQHFLYMTYLDRNGENFTYPPNMPIHPEPYLFDRTPENPSFAIDSEGNIYLSHSSYHSAPLVGNLDVEYTVEDGDICAVQFWCDYRMVGVVPIDSTHAFTPQILKFSPHFDTLLQSRYIYQKTNQIFVAYDAHLEIEDDDNVYFIIKQSPLERYGTVVIDSIKNLSFEVSARWHGIMGVAVRFSQSLDTKGMILIKDTITDTTNFMGVIFSWISDIAFDRDSDYVIVSCTVHKEPLGRMDNANNSFFTVNGSPIDFDMNAGFVVLTKDSLQLKSYGQLNSMTSGISASLPVPHGNLTCGNNRIFFQSCFSGEVTYPNQTIHTPDPTPSTGYQWSTCLSVFDYNGNMIEGIDYQAYSPNNDPGPINLVGNTLYLCNRLASDATFGDIYTPSRGSYFASIAKYTDPAFESTYERPRDTTVCVEVQEEITVVRYPNPTTGRLTIELISLKENYLKNSQFMEHNLEKILIKKKRLELILNFWKKEELHLMRLLKFLFAKN